MKASVKALQQFPTTSRATRPAVSRTGARAGITVTTSPAFDPRQPGRRAALRTAELKALVRFGSTINERWPPPRAPVSGGPVMLGKMKYVPPTPKTPGPGPTKIY
jgi:hypothetical protein